jgi:hypothetical protein
MNNLAQNNLTWGISKNDLAAATSWLTFGRGPTERGEPSVRPEANHRGLGLTLCVRTPLRGGAVEAATNAIGRCARRHRSFGIAASASSDRGPGCASRSDLEPPSA